METFAKNDNRITNIIFGFTKLLKQNLGHFWNVCTIWMLFTCLSVQIVQSKFILFDITVSPFQTSVAFYRETSHLICSANQMTGFYMTCNTGWNGLMLKLFVTSWRTFCSTYYTYTLDLGILDQGAGLIVLFDDKPSDKTYENTLEIIQRMGGLVDSLYNKAKKLS